MTGKTIGNYKLGHKLGEGGMAEVWYAQDPSGNAVAVKILREEFVKQTAILDRFRGEAELMMTLQHPHIRQVHSYGTIEGRPAIVMEYLEGEDLSSRLRRGERWSDSQLESWWIAMADTLDYIHARQVIHRDIKPSNIFLTDTGIIKLLDFGIAKVKGATTITRTGSRMGTLMYMSPEQVKDSKHLDYRSDLYSLAVTFCHLITGQAPYDSTISEFDVQTKIVMEPLDTKLLPAKWRSLLEPLLIKEPDKRGFLRRRISTSDDATIIDSGTAVIGRGKRSTSRSDDRTIPQPTKEPRIKRRGWVIISILLVLVMLFFIFIGFPKSTYYHYEAYPHDEVDTLVYSEEDTSNYLGDTIEHTFTEPTVSEKDRNATLEQTEKVYTSTPRDIQVLYKPSYLLNRSSSQKSEVLPGITRAEYKRLVESLGAVPLDEDYKQEGKEMDFLWQNHALLWDYSNPTSQISYMGQAVWTIAYDPIKQSLFYRFVGTVPERMIWALTDACGDPQERKNGYYRWLSVDDEGKAFQVEYIIDDTFSHIKLTRP